MNKTKQALSHSVIALLLCISMLIGTTYAWFTDSVTSGSNIIKSGNLDLEMYWTDDPTTGTWHDVEDPAYNKIFDYDNWEPGYTEVRYVKLVNAGNLALNYQLTLTPEGSVGKLAEVINVYAAEGEVELKDRSDLSKLRAMGLLTSVLDGGAAAEGSLLPEGQESLWHDTKETVLTIAMSMITTAGNDYQDESVGDGFSIKALATQCPYEKDSFGSDYDSNAEYPVSLVGKTASAAVKVVDGKVAEAVTIAGNGISARVPAGVAVKDGVDKLTVKITPLESTTTDITVVNNEILIPVDVHIEGVAEGNTTPIIVDLGEILPKYLNMGNYALIHVEDGVNNTMTLVNDPANLTAHNQFTYDPLTGAVTVSMASFSEVALVADTSKPWKGEVDHSWYKTSKTSDTDLKIANADQLYSFAKIVGGMAQDKDDNGTVSDIAADSFKGQTIKLLSDINLNYGTVLSDGNEFKTIFYPVGYYNSDDKANYDDKTGIAITSGLKNFEGTFDGNGHTISNIYQNTWEMKGDHDWYAPEDQHYRDGMGLFGRVYGGTIKNLTVDNFESDGEITTTGVIAAYADGATFENIAITNCNPRVYNIGNGGIVGCVGWYAKKADLKTIFKNITVDNSNMISALWGSYDVACGGIVGQYYPTSGQTSAGSPPNAGIDLINCHVAAQMDVYNDVCGNYQYYAYRYAGILLGSVRENETIDGRVYPKMDGITAKDCTVHFGTWNDYYYCEFEKNGHPSYSGPTDYKFSRVPHSELEFTDSNGNEKIDTADERASVTGCKHEHTAAEDNQAVYLPFNNLVTGYGWGVTTKAVGQMEGVTILDREEANSVVKFEKEDTAKDSYTTGTTVTIGELFKVATIEDKKLSIKGDKVQVTVSPKAGTNNTVSGTYVADTNKWTQGTLTFNGTGAATVTITDYYFCTPTTINITVTERVAAEKFEKKFDKDFLYRVGNQNAVKLDSLFKAKDGAKIGTVSVTIETVKGASGTYTSNATWTNGTIQFNGTGVVKVTIKDDDEYCTPTLLYLEVVDAVNATTATNATSNNVVLLNDIGSGFTVSGRYAVYGNGFTLNYTGNGQYLNNGLKQGVVTVSENGILDNLRIKATIYPKAYLYYGVTTLGDYVQGGPSSVEGDKTRYHYQLSAVAASGNATITNCYIYGGRNNIFVNSGDVTVKDTILECGTVANVQIQSNSNHTVTFEDVTTIQHRVNATIGDTAQIMLGGGILVGPDTETNPTIVLDGEFKQYNWVTEDDHKAVTSDTAKMIIEAALAATEYNHTVNGKTASNLGIVYMNTYKAPVTNNTGLPYKLNINVKISAASGQVYTLCNAPAEQIYSDYENADRTTVNGLYEPQFKYSSNLGGQYIEKDSGDEHCYREGDTIHVMFPSGDTKELDLAALVNIAKYTDQDLKLVITCKDSNGNPLTVTDGKVALSAADEYSVTYTVTDNLFYDRDGKKTDTGPIEYSWNITIGVSLKDTAIPNAYFEFDSSKQVIYRSGNSNIKQFIPFLAGLKIYDYNGQTSYLRFDGDNDFNKVAKATINNVNTTGEAQGYHIVTIELVDGGKLIIDMDVRANSGSSTHSGSIKVRNNVLYVVNGGTTSGKGQTWKIYSYKFIGNNGTEINSGLVTFGTAGVDCSTATAPSSNFNTTIKYTVTYNANEGNCGQTVGYATSVSAAVTLPTPTRSGHIFAGWYTAASGGTRVGGAGESYTPSANVTLYAQWGKPCTVTYNANGGSCGTASEKYTGTALTLPTPTRDGYWFVGWYDAAEGGNKIGEAGASYNPSGEITLYAHWQEAIKYTVTYNANGGTCSTASATYQGTALTLPTPTRTGYKFLGWYTATSGGTKIGDAGALYIPSANITLYAQWEQISYTITISKQENATVTVDKTTAHYNDTISVTVSFSQSNSKTLTVKDASGNTVLSKSAAGTYTFTMPASNVTVEASSSGACFTPDTLITLADGTQKRVDEVSFGDKILAWDFFTGSYVEKDIALLVNHGEALYEVANLQFSDDTMLRIIAEHGVFDYDLNKFVYITVDNMNEYVGHRFVKYAADGSYDIVTLVKAYETEEYTSAWSITSADSSNAFASGLLTVAPPEDFYNWIEMEGKLTYDVEQFQKDVETYGLYTYDDFKDYVTYEQFVAWNGAYLKVAVEKGYFTFEYILELIELYKGWMP